MIADSRIESFDESISPSILIMEDDLNVAKGLKMILDEQGYNVDLQDTGYGAIDAMGTNDYDLLMADIRLPDIDGIKVVKQVRENKPDTEVIVMTGYATSSLAVDTMKMGVHDFIAKPFTEERIKQSIKSALANTSLRVNKDKEASKELKKNVSIQKREVLKVLNRTAEDEDFWYDLMEEGGAALDGYELSHEAKAAIASGDLQWINENVGELTQKQLMFIYKRLEREAW